MTDYMKIELAECARDGAVPVKNSGRGLFKCDATLGDFGIDYKCAEKSFTLDIGKWAKVTTDAWKNGGRTPALKVIFSPTKDPLRVWIISDESMKEYLELLKDAHGRPSCGQDF